MKNHRASWVLRSLGREHPPPSCQLSSPLHHCTSTAWSSLRNVSTLEQRLETNILRSGAFQGLSLPGMELLDTAGQFQEDCG